MLRFRLFGFPVSVEWFFWLSCFLLGGGIRMQSMNDLPGILLWTIAVFFSILIHELGHAFVAKRYGATPIIHLHGMGGFMAHNAALNRKQSIAVSAAGPGASLALGIATLLVILIIPPNTSGGELLSTYMIWINFFWTFINLLPILPLDGGQIARDVLGPSRSEITRWIGVFFAGAIAFAAFSVGQVFLGLMLAYLGFMNYQQQPSGPTA
jgi:stage IV sporulation protein FB